MLTSQGFSIRKADPRYKYEDHIAQWLDHHPDFIDEDCGDVEHNGRVARYGRTLVHHDDRGFVTRASYPSVRDASAVFDALRNLDDAEWGEIDDDEPSIDREANTARAEAYLRYVVHCASEGLEAFPNEQWHNYNQPKGPLG